MSDAAPKQRVELTTEPGQGPAQRVVLVNESTDSAVKQERRLTRIEWQLRALALFVAVPKLAGHDPSQIVTGAIQLLHQHI